MTVTTDCSWCGGYGLRQELYGVEDCTHCGGGHVWPPYCTVCSAFASMDYPCKKCARRSTRKASPDVGH